MKIKEILRINRIKLVTFILVLIFLTPILTAFEKDDLIELEGAINGRAFSLDKNGKEKIDFRKSTHNVRAVLPKGTIGKIVDKIELSEREKNGTKYRNIGFKIEITEGARKGETYWIYHDLEKPLVHLSKSTKPSKKDFTEKVIKSSGTVSPTEANSLQLKAKLAALKVKTNRGKDEVEEGLPNDSNDGVTDESAAESSDEEKETNDKALALLKGALADFNQLNVSSISSQRDCVEHLGLSDPTSFAEKPESESELMKNYKKLGGDPLALTQALCFLDKNKNKTLSTPEGRKRIGNKRYITINDQNKDIYSNRLFVLDLETNEVKSYFTGHGQGKYSDELLLAYEKNPGTFSFDPYEEKPEFSNRGGSNQTPRGFQLTAEINEDSQWDFALKLHGLQPGINDNNFKRPIVMHPMPKSDNIEFSSSDPNYKPIKNELRTLTEGCTDVPLKYARAIFNKIKNGSIYYTYTPTEKDAGPHYCGER